MGADLKGVINHNLNTRELLKLPSKIDAWKEIEEIILEELPKTYSQEYVKEKYSNLRSSYFNKNLAGAAIESKPDEKYFELVWKQWEEDYDGALSSIHIITYFSFITVNRNTLIVEQMPWHKYSNLDDKDMAKMIFKINRIIANELDQNLIVYFPDSAYPTSILYNYANEGKTVEELIEIGDAKFLNRPVEIKEGIQFKYFVDDLSDDLTKLEDLDNSEKYWKWNLELKKYEQTNTLHNKL